MIQLADACVGLTTFIFEIVQAAKTASGLPVEIEELRQRLPYVKSVFEQASANLCNTTAPPVEVKSVLKQCETHLQDVKTIFKKTCPKDNSPQATRLWKAAWAKTSGRIDELQSIWRKIEGNLTLLSQGQIVHMGNTMKGVETKLDSLVQQGERDKSLQSGNIARDVSIEHQSTDARRTGAAVPSPWMVNTPASRTLFGYGRHVKQLHSRLLQDQRRPLVFVIYGMAGVGKSEVVLQLLARYRSDIEQRSGPVRFASSE